MKIVRGGLVTIAVVLAGCAGRSPQPVAVVQPQDHFMDCPAIQAEVLANNVKVQDLASESGGKVAQNVVAGVAGLFIWPLWFAMDFQGATDKETIALNSRQQYLAVLAQQRGCGGPIGQPMRTIAQMASTAPATLTLATPIQAVAGPPGCRPDTLSYCASVEPGKGRILACLRAHAGNISAPCTAALAVLPQRR